MAQFTPLARLQSLLYPLVQQNEVSDAMLMGPAIELGQIDGTVDMLRYDGRFVDPNTVRIEADLSTLTQVAALDRMDGNTPVYAPLIDWTKRYRSGDDIILGGSTKGNNGIHVIASVSAGQMTLTTACASAEEGLVYGKPTYELLNRCRELLLFPGGYETDTQLRTLLGQWLTIMQKRGSSYGVVAEMNRVTNSTSSLLQSAPGLTTLATNVSYTHSSLSLGASGWAGQVSAGSNIVVTGSTKDSNGRYTVYSTTSNTVVIGHRARHSSSYPENTLSNVAELQFREDRVLNRIWVRLQNTTTASKTFGFTVTATGPTFSAGTLVSGTGTVSVANSVATLLLTAAAGSTAEAVLTPSGGTMASWSFQVAMTSGAPTAIRMGEMGLCPTGTDGLPKLTAIWPWLWGGIVKTGLRSQMNETGLSVYALTKPGFYVGVSSPDSAEEDAYTMASPDEFVVVEVDHRNPANYTTQDLGTLVRDVLLPADVAGVLGLL